jgi:cohesin loading factor subunit SCC2
LQLSSLDDIATSNQASDNNAAKTIALDHLGTIAAKLRGSALKTNEFHDKNDSLGKKIRPLDEVSKFSNG